MMEINNIEKVAQKENAEKETHNKKVNAYLVQNYNNRIQTFLVEMLENPKEIKEYRNKEYNFLDKDAQLSDLVRKGFYFSNFKNGEKERIVSIFKFYLLVQT